MEERQNFLEKFWYLFVVVAVFSLGAITFLWMNNQNVNRAEQSQEVQTTTPQEGTAEELQQEEIDEATQRLDQQSESDEIEDIEYDLQTTDFTDIDKELDEIEKIIEEE